MDLKAIFKPLSPYGVDQQYIEKEEDVPEGWTEVWPPQPCWKPTYDWNANTWIETATEEEIDPPQVEELTDIQQLAQEFTALELTNFEKDNLISELKKETKMLGQQSTDNELRLIELEEKLNV